MVTCKDIRNCCVATLTLASCGVLVGQAGYLHNTESNEIGVLVSGLVFLSYIIHLIGVLEVFKIFDTVGVNLAMFCHGFQLCYYYYNSFVPEVSIPPLVLGSLFIVYLILCGDQLAHFIDVSKPAEVGEPDESEFV